MDKFYYDEEGRCCYFQREERVIKICFPEEICSKNSYISYKYTSENPMEHASFYEIRDLFNFWGMVGEGEIYIHVSDGIKAKFDEGAAVGCFIGDRFEVNLSFHFDFVGDFSHNTLMEADDEYFLKICEWASYSPDSLEYILHPDGLYIIQEGVNIYDNRVKFLEYQGVKRVKIPGPPEIRERLVGLGKIDWII